MIIFYFEMHQKFGFEMHQIFAFFLMAAFFVVAEIEQMQGWKCIYWLCDKQLKEMRDAERERKRRHETDC